jgi:hypothetical protein
MKRVFWQFVAVAVLLPACALGAEPRGSLHAVASGSQAAAHRGVYEVAIEAADPVDDPFGSAPFVVTFTRPDGSSVKVEGFINGDRTWQARAYCDAVGQWSWTSSSTFAGLDRKSGTFRVEPSTLPGKLRKHPRDPHQFAYDNGEWFLHIGDTGYRYVVQSEPEWRAYIDQAADMGATKIRTWFCQSRGGVEALFSSDRRTPNLPYWQEIDRRVRYALEHHPRVILKLIAYGEDTDELIRYGQGDKVSQWVARYAQARFSAMPNVMWCISNDREIVADGAKLGGRRVPASVIDRIGRDMAAREPWDTLLTNHQARGTGYAFLEAPWSNVVTLEDLDQVDGRVLLKHRPLAEAPVVNDEDRYELYKPPKHPAYFFRRLMWASLFSGGHATYGGLKTYEPYDGKLQGVRGYADVRREGKVTGADDFLHIHRFFSEARLTLVNMKPNDKLVNGDPLRAKCIHDENTYLIYLANPDGTKPETDNAATVPPKVALDAPSGSYAFRWFNPTSGKWHDTENAQSGRARIGQERLSTLEAPGGGDWVLIVSRRD